MTRDTNEQNHSSQNDGPDYNRKGAIATYARRLAGQLFDSLSIPAYRWLWFNSLFGTMRLIAVFVARGWLVLVLTDSPFWVGAAPAMRGITQILLGTFMGVLLDRVDRRYALLTAEIGTTVVSLIVGLLVLFDQITLWHILVASVIEGVFVSVRWPAINTMIYQAVGSDRVLNASAAQMFGFNLGNIVASAVTGLIVAGLGIEFGYFFSATCGTIAAITILFIPGKFRSESASITEPVMDALKAGLTYIWQSPALTFFIILGFLMSFLGWSNLTMLPVIARDVLGREAAALGYLTAAGAAGSLISTTVIAGLGNVKNKPRLVLVAGILTSVGILLFASSSIFWLSLVLSALMQGALMAFEVSLTAAVLLSTSDEMQGRVQGVYSQVFGFTWVGGVALGGIATFLGAPIAIAIGGILIGVAVALFWRPLSKLVVAT